MKADLYFFHLRHPSVPPLPIRLPQQHPTGTRTLPQTPWGNVRPGPYLHPPCPINSRESLSQTQDPEVSLRHKLGPAEGDHHTYLQGVGVVNPALLCCRLVPKSLPGQFEEGANRPKHCSSGSIPTVTKGLRQHTCSRKPGYFQMKTAWVSYGDNT